MTLIASGSLTPEVDPADFGLPPHTAVRWEVPDDRLRPFLSAYHVLDSDGPYFAGSPSPNWMLPGWPAIRVMLADRRMEFTIGNRRYDPVHVASLYGTTTRAAAVKSYGGVTIGASIGPLGWSRLFGAPADRFRDRVVPLGEALPARVVEDLVGRLRVLTDVVQVKSALDGFFLEQLGPPTRDEPTIAALAGVIEQGAITDLAQAAAAVGVDGGALRRLSTRYFGFPPKTLLMRARFMRAFMPMLLTRTLDTAHVLGPYHDVPHFLRDARRFLTMTPRRFLALEQPYVHAVYRAYVQVMTADAAQRVGTGSAPT